MDMHMEKTRSSSVKVWLDFGSGFWGRFVQINSLQGRSGVISTYLRVRGTNWVCIVLVNVVDCQRRPI